MAATISNEELAKLNQALRQFAVPVLDHSDGSLVDMLLVSHPTLDLGAFEAAWSTAATEALDAGGQDPGGEYGEYTVDAIVSFLQKSGWKVQRGEFVKVWY